MAVINGNEIFFGVIAAVGEENIPPDESSCEDTVKSFVADAEYSPYTMEDEA